jgi:hypothetical protein
MEKQESSPRAEPAAAEDVVTRLARQQSTLTDFLSSIDGDARLMDASLDDAHEIAVSIGQAVRQGVFGSHGPLDLRSYRDSYDTFESVRADESDIYEVYADDLERHRKRQRKDLGLAESDSDKFVVVKRRRGYISALTALQAQVSDILNLVQEPHVS